MEGNEMELHHVISCLFLGPSPGTLLNVCIYVCPVVDLNSQMLHLRGDELIKGALVGHKDSQSVLNTAFGSRVYP